MWSHPLDCYVPTLAFLHDEGGVKVTPQPPNGSYCTPFQSHAYNNHWMHKRVAPPSQSEQVYMLCIPCFIQEEGYSATVRWVGGLPLLVKSDKVDESMKGSPPRLAYIYLTLSHET